MQPKLSLGYNSGLGNGSVGSGWSVSTGFPQAITRGRNILARDGTVRRVNFDNDDKFYLDGKRLIRISGTGAYGTPGSGYRTEVDSFVSITTSGSGAHIDTFVITDKDGRKMTYGKYGSSTDGFQLAAGASETLAYAYALKCVEDAVGNTIVFSYTDVLESGSRIGEYVLSEIRYTGHITQTGLDLAVLTFDYNTNTVAGSTARLDRGVSYIGGRAIALTRRLDKINATFNGTPVGYFDLVYDYAPNSGPLRLTSVSPSLRDPNGSAILTMPATTLTWGTGNSPGAPASFDNSELRRAADIVGDFNGDGRHDFLLINKIPGSPNPAELYLAYGGTSASPVEIATPFGTDAVFPVWYSHNVTIDFNGDGMTDLVWLRPVSAASGGGWYVSLSTGSGFQSAVQIPLSGTSFNPSVLGARAVVADFNGDGLDDMLIQHPVTPGFVLVTTQVSGSTVTFSSQNLTTTAIGVGSFSDTTSISYEAADFDGDGLADLLVTGSDIITKAQGTEVGVGFGSATVHVLRGLGNGSFVAAAGTSLYPAGGYPVDYHAPASSTGVPSMAGIHNLKGDVNGDGLEDLMCLSFNHLTSALEGQWSVALAKGDGTFDTTSFASVPVELSFDGATVRTFNQNPGILSTTSVTENEDLYTVVQGIYGFQVWGAQLLDYNHDGRKDFVWYSPIKGWICAFAKDAGFDTANAISLFGGQTNSSAPWRSYVLDIDGNGFDDLVFADLAGDNSYIGSTDVGGKSRLAALTPRSDHARVVAVTNGLGSSATVAYGVTTDASIYTVGTAVTYPIREVRRAQHVVSDVWQDSGVNGQNSHFSYQYSGARLDLSGRGNLGFHSFVTLDRQTNLFKYQFLTQSFPMTGLTAREETYRYLGGGKFRFISSHDNTVVFDEVVKSPADPTRWGTVWPYISKAVESRWENSTDEHFTLSASGPSSQPEALFPQSKPSGEHIKITAESWFDGETATHATLPGSFNPSDTTSGGVNAVTGVTNYSTIAGLGLPGKIYYGNLTRLMTDYGDSFTETVTTAYHPATGGLTGLVSTVSTSVTAPSPYSSDAAPTKSYTYWTNGAVPTPLVLTETIDATGDELDLKTTYTRDPLGRVTNTQLTGYTNATHVRHIGDYSVFSVPTGAFDSKFDLPSTTKNAEPYEHTTTTAYHSLLGKPSSSTDVNGVAIETTYDALGRATKVKNVSTGIETVTEYAWTSSSATDWKVTQTVSVPSGVTGITGNSVFAVRTLTTAQPAVVVYFDRLGRMIRTVKNGFNAQTATTDTVYNLLGQVVAVSNPYASTATHWSKSEYDELGRAKEVIGANLTKTATEYIGRATKVKVTAKAADGTTDLADQTNTTLVDAKGRTVKVWNADNVPAFTGMKGETTSTASIEFKLDGFGRMRATKLKDQTAQITATYDPLGRQETLNDPDKGPWSYINNALGQVVSQTDALPTVTLSSFDHLGRPLSRTTTENGTGAPVESANWYYYDSSANSTWNLVAPGTKGWIGALQRTTHTLSSAPGYADTGSTKYFYYDAKGRPQIVLSNIDNKWFYTHTTYDTSNRVDTMRHYWRPSPHEEAPNSYPGLWSNFGYTYAYNAQSYVLTVKDTNNRTWWEAHTTNGYDYLDRPVLVQKGSGHWTQRSYRMSDGVLEFIKTGPTAGATTIQNLSFGFDGLGNLRSRTGSGGTETLDYDILNRLTNSAQGTVSYYDNGNIKRKANVSGTMAPADFGYGATQPHAVTSAFGYTLAYDVNGNLETRTASGEIWTLRWTGFDKPRWMAKTVGSVVAGSEFLYDANRSRVLHLEFDAITGSGANAVPSHYTRKKIYAAGAEMELDYANTAATGSPAWQQKKIRLYIPAPDGTAGAVELTSSDVGGVQHDLVYHHDHLGSIESITNFGSAVASAYATDSGGKGGVFSEDAWGARRDPIDWAGAPSTTDDGGPDSLTPRGFTGHEMLDGLGLVHMNGRIYDPLLGRMLSADIVVQAPGNLQAYNRYSYVMNNPTTYTDPTGFFWDPNSGFWGASEWGIFGKAAVVDPAVEGYKSGSLDMEKGMTEIANAQGGVDVTIGMLHLVAGVGAGVGVVADYAPGGRQVKGTANVLAKNADEIAEGASKLTKAFAEKMDNISGGAGKLERKLDDAAVDAKRLEVDSRTPATADVKGGVHDETKLPVGDGKDSHHMPSRESNGGMPDSLAPTTKMDPADHAKTLSNGQSGLAGAEFRQAQGELWNSGDAAKMRQAMANEVKDVRRASREVSGDATKYNEGMQEMLKKANDNYVLPDNPKRQ